MASERDIKRRIKTVRNTQQITKAMKMVASARIKKADDRLKAARPYSAKLQEIMQVLVDSMDEVLHPLMDRRPVKRVGILVVTSDKGLCGAYNNNLLKQVWSYVGTRDPRNYELIVVGGKGDKFFRRRKVVPHASHTGWSPDFHLAQSISDEVTDWFASGRVDEFVCFYTQSVSAATQKPAQETLLPIAPAKGEGASVSFEFEPSPEQALNILLPRYIRNTLYRILLESRVSELGARLKSMSNATDNANKLAGELTLDYYRIRQNSITNEILEISGGAEALRASG
jgi:F-type H+-transporting ATPase subunit gamma